MKSIIKIILLSLLTLISFSSCQESKRKRIEREAKEFTEKNCPRMEFDNIIFLDSLVCHNDEKNDSLVCHNDEKNDYVYYYSVNADSAKIADMKTKHSDTWNTLLKAVRSSVDLRYIKNEGLNIVYVYSDAKTHKKIDEYRFTIKNYQ